MKYPRYLLFFLLFVLTQACAATQVKQSTTPPPTKTARIAKPRVKELVGCVGDRYQIDLLEAIVQIPDDTLDAQREQVRDWIFTTTLARIAQTKGLDEVFTGVLIEPVFRDDSLGHVLRMQHGATRSTTTKSGDAVVLVEAADPATLSAHIAEAIDNEAIHLGVTPTETRVYQYVLQPEVARAEVCAMKSMARAEFENTAQQYRTATLTTAAEFEKFLSGGVDLLSAQCTEAGLEVKGRQRPRNAGAPITVEHIAALSQARGTEFIPVERFGTSLAELSPKSRKVLDHNAQVVDHLDQPLEIQSPAIQVVAAWKREHPRVSTQELFMSLDLQEKSYGRPGFSLDPHPSPSFATYLLDEFIAALPDIQKTAAIFRGLHEKERADDIIDLAESTREPFAAEAKAILIAARAKIAATKDDATIEAIFYQKLPTSLGNSFAREILSLVGRNSTQQCSRYDGPLYGTATGMTFFYTDLLAKVWGIDYEEAAPEGLIEGFHSKTHGAVNTVSCSEVGGENTRTWLGLREEGFTRESTGAVHFAPVTTRIFAKSSNAGERDKEFEANAQAKRFVQWWDEHFTDVAAWEPQFELLNQIMKWSVVVHQATAEKKESCFALLDKVPVRANHRIDKWLTENKKLRWQGPIKLLPPPKGQVEKPGDPECLELLESKPFPECGGTNRYSGGVSAADLGTITRKPTRVAEIAPEMARWTQNTKSARSKDGKVEFDSIETTTGKLQRVTVESRPEKASFKAEIDVNVSQRGITSSAVSTHPVKQVDKTAAKVNKTVVVTDTRNRLLNAELKASDLDLAVVHVEVHRGPMLEAKTLAHQLVEQMATDSVNVAVAAKSVFREGQRVKVVNENAVAWELPNSGTPPKFAVMESGGGNRGPPPGNAETSFSVGVPDDGSRRAGGSEANRNPNIRVTIVPQAALASYGPSVSDLDLDRDKGAKLLDEALAANNDAAVATQIDADIRQSAPPSKLRQQQKKIHRELAQRRRDGKETAALEKEALKLAIAERKQLESARKHDAPPDPTQATVYAPTGYSVGNELPPAVHAPTKVLRPNEQFVTRTLEEHSVKTLPADVQVNGLKLAKQREGQPLESDYAAVGAASRLLGGGYHRIHVIVPCNDQDMSMAPCHARPSPEALQRYQEAMKCDLDGNGHLAGKVEIECLDTLSKQMQTAKPSTKTQ